MTLYQFLALNDYEQAEAVWNGEFIGTRKECASTFILYSIGDFFAEVSYQGDLNEILSIKPFKSIRLLEAYLESISLEEIQSLF